MCNFSLEAQSGEKERRRIACARAHAARVCKHESDFVRLRMRESCRAEKEGRRMALVLCGCKFVVRHAGDVLRKNAKDKENEDKKALHFLCFNPYLMPNQRQILPNDPLPPNFLATKVMNREAAHRGAT